MFVLCILYVMYYRCKLPSSLWDWLTLCKLNLLFYALSAISPPHLECKLVSCDMSLKKKTSVLSALLSDMAPQWLEGVWIWMKSPLACCHCCQNKLEMALIKLFFTDKWWATQITLVTINMTVYTCMINMIFKKKKKEVCFIMKLCIGVLCWKYNLTFAIPSMMLKMVPLQLSSFDQLTLNTQIYHICWYTSLHNCNLETYIKKKETWYYCNKSIWQLMFYTSSPFFFFF